MRFMPKKASIFFIVICIFLAIAANAGLQIWRDYQETFQRQETTAHDISRVVEAQIHNNVRQAEATLSLIAEAIQEKGGLEFFRDAAHWKKLHAYCHGLTGCLSIAIVNPAGQIVALSDVQNTAPIDVSDRVYFRGAKASKHIFIGPAVISRVPGNPILFSIARSVSDANGKLLAVASVGMDTAHLTEFYGLMGFTVNPTITVFKGNGDLVARNPDITRFVGGNFSKGPLFTTQLPKAPSGVYRSHSVLDGKERIASYQSIKDLDLVIFAGIDIHTAMRYWKVRAGRTVLSNTFALTVILLAFYWGYRSLGQARRLREKNIELDRISNIDAMTGLANRRHFNTTLTSEWTRHFSEGKPFSLILIDVDHFKEFNDIYGHQAGDECLHQVAIALQNTLMRNVDLVARYGGEEFVAVLDIDQNGASAVAERMRATVQALALPHAGSSAAPVVTISLGVASIPSNSFNTPAELVSAADQALYAAKRKGRNQVAVYAAPKSA